MNVGCPIGEGSRYYFVYEFYDCGVFVLLRFAFGYVGKIVGVPAFKGFRADAETLGNLSLNERVGRELYRGDSSGYCAYPFYSVVRRRPCENSRAVGERKTAVLVYYSERKQAFGVLRNFNALDSFKADSLGKPAHYFGLRKIAVLQ